MKEMNTIRRMMKNRKLQWKLGWDNGIEPAKVAEELGWSIDQKTLEGYKNYRKIETMCSQVMCEACDDGFSGGRGSNNPPRYFIAANEKEMRIIATTNIDNNKGRLRRQAQRINGLANTQILDKARNFLISFRDQ